MCHSHKLGRKEVTRKYCNYSADGKIIGVTVAIFANSGYGIRLKNYKVKEKVFDDWNVVGVDGKEDIFIADNQDGLGEYSKIFIENSVGQIMDF
jgi:hypothetical protein